MTDNNLISEYIDKVKRESTYRKCIDIDLINELIELFDVDCKKIKYSKNIDDCLSLALTFYKHYNYEYYEMIMQGLENSRINIDAKDSETDLQSNKCYIKMRGDDNDVYLIVHEFAHYIDRNSTPYIIPNEIMHFGEVYSMYLERKLEQYLDENQYEQLNKTRKHNRIYFAKRMARLIPIQLNNESFFNTNGYIDEADLEIDKIKRIMNYKSQNTVNYLLRYLLGYVLSYYLIKNNTVNSDKQISQILTEVDVQDAIMFFDIEDELGIKQESKEKSQNNIENGNKVKDLTKQRQ